MPATAAKTEKRRAPMSCDRCKSRKTKCVDPVPGPCRFCASIQAVCHLDPSRRRQRPYYHVSEEEFRYMTKALQHFLPNVELNLESLRAVVQSFDAADRPPVPAQVSAGEADDAGEDTVLVSSASSSSSSASTADSVHESATPASTADSRKPDDAAALTLDEIDAMHGALGWLRLDANGTYRYVGADSSYGFNAAVRALHQPCATPTDVLPPLTASPPLPPPPAVPDGPGTASPSGTAQNAYTRSGGTATQIFLPRRDLCNRCVARFFRDIQSVYWFWSAERFHAELDRLYGGDPASATPALLGSLYAMLALTCEREAAAAPSATTDSTAPDPAAAAAARYLGLAKALAPALCDAADADSVRALCLLALALQSALCTTTAAVYVGAAARIALSLGLHHPRPSATAAAAAAAFAPRSCLQRQIDVRLYATLFLLDTDIALCYGTPPALADADTATVARDLSERILSPGSYMPLDCLPIACHLAQIRRRLRRLLYARPPPSSSPVPATVAAVRDELAALRAWYAALPAHLRNAALAPFHQRAVAVLHLRYWSAVVFATRPFLLYRARRRRRAAAAEDKRYDNNNPDPDPDSLPPAKHAAFAALAATCVDAARQALRVVGFMRDAGLLSSLVSLDTGCLVEILEVFLLARATGEAAPETSKETDEACPSPGSLDDAVHTCLRTLQGMDQFFWTRHVLAEVRAQLHEVGLLPHRSESSTTIVTAAYFPGAQTTAAPGRFFYNVPPLQGPGPAPDQLATTLAGSMDSCFLDLNDAFFAVADDAASTAPLLPASFEACMAPGGMAL